MDLEDVMPSDTELERLAAMGNALRPEWPVKSLLTHLRNHHATRAYRDLAVALAWVATDPATLTPARLAESGPWWRATEESGRVPTGRRIDCPDHPGEPSGRCRPCADQRATPEQIRAARAMAAELMSRPSTPEGDDQ